MRAALLRWSGPEEIGLRLGRSRCSLQLRYGLRGAYVGLRITDCVGLRIAAALGMGSWLRALLALLPFSFLMAMVTLEEPPIHHVCALAVFEEFQHYALHVLGATWGDTSPRVTEGGREVVILGMWERDGQLALRQVAALLLTLS